MELLRQTRGLWNSYDKELASAVLDVSFRANRKALAEPIELTAVREGHMTAFHSGEPVITHRVTQNHTFEGEFVTKGDASEEDMRAIPYEALIGQAIWHIPMMGGILALLTGTVGKLYLLALTGTAAYRK